ncbi:hypothetical protein MLOOGBEN_09805 [Bacillus sp. EB106-08-02-XG196]|uniref:hypothetical protein n=1 Tax=Bacillus sp. EB106-08-02-XG196 TaxID=2737049 RepID=UPI0015C453D5|nr:hypothetical protein [Bacillus sp. EB106-08-02-XG196]NWQ40989.1 hypothetical protein [Bacillus sp. EB106-08-02-XG196]
MAGKGGDAEFMEDLKWGLGFLHIFVIEKMMMASLTTGSFQVYKVVGLIRQINKWFMQVNERKMQVGV